MSDRFIISGSGQKSFDRKLFPDRQGRLAVVLFDLFQYRFVVGGIGNDRHGPIIFGRAPQHRGPTNVDLFDRLLDLHVRPSDRTLKRIEVHDDQIDRLDLILRCLSLVFRVVPEVEQTAVHPRMEGFQASVQDLREPCEFFDFEMRNRLLPEECRRAAGRNDLDTHLGESTGERYNARLIRNRNECALNLHESKKNNRFSRVV